MKKIAILITAFVLAGCQSVPVVPKWPSAPKDLVEACPDLKTINTANEKLSVVLETVTDNYKEYYDCKSKVDDWIIWYKGQQKIWETIK